MSSPVSFYALDTGLFTGGTYAGPAAWLEANTPPGCAAWPGQVDATRQRVDVATGQLVDYQPPAPPADELRTWAWDAQQWTWVAVPTLAAQLRQGEQVLQRTLDAGAQAWGYDSIISAASYAASTAPQFAAEAAALITWRDTVWLWAGQLQAAVQSGQALYPDTEAELIAAMPAQPTRPTLE